MIQVLFRRVSDTGTTGVWLAKIDTDLQQFCPRVYGKGLKNWTKDFRDFRIVNYALNICNYSLQLWCEV